MPGSDSQPRAGRTLTPEQQIDRYRTLLRENKLRVTGVRLAILKVLEDANEAMNAQQVYDRVSSGGSGRKSAKGGRRLAESGGGGQVEARPIA